MGGAHAEAEGAAAALRAPHRPVLLMAGRPLLPALLLLALLGAQPCSCGRAPASSPHSVTARLAAKWPATPLLLEARCVQPPPPPPTAFRGCRGGPLGRGRGAAAITPLAVSWGRGCLAKGQEEGGVPFFSPLRGRRGKVSGRKGWLRFSPLFPCGRVCQSTPLV